ncbi:MAG: YbbR-like domain-containing protein [Omnitrophica WOR_2 bacterium]
MTVSLLRWLGKNLGTLLTAFILALVVWVSAVTAADPNREDPYPRQITIEQKSLDPGLLIIGEVPSSVRLTLNAPESIWSKMSNDPNAIRAWIDLSNLSAGEHTVPVQVQVNYRPVRVVSEDPSDVRLLLEPLVTRSFTLTLTLQGSAAMGYNSGTPEITPDRVTVSGAESRVKLVKQVHADLDITNVSQTIDTMVKLKPLDVNGNVVDGVTLTPDSITVKEPITLRGGYLNVIVKVITRGQVANGYKLTNIVVTPPNVIVFASDPRLLNDLPGYVETVPLNLSGLEDYIETPLDLNLPQGISVVNDQKVLVQVSVAPIESNLTVSLPVEVIGLQPGLSAVVAPTTIDVILSGPVPVLSTLVPSEIRAVVDLTGKAIGTYQMTPSVSFLPSKVTTQSIIPSPVEVTIIKAPTPTPTPLPTVTPTPTRRP